MQHKRSYENGDNYALLATDMVGYDMGRVRRHEYPSFEEIKPRIAVLDTIGKLNDRLRDATLKDDKKVYVAGGYQVLVPQDVIQHEGKTFEEFVGSLKDKIKQELQRQKSPTQTPNPLGSPVMSNL